MVFTALSFLRLIKVVFLYEDEMSVRLYVLATKSKFQLLSAGKRSLTKALLKPVMDYVMRRNLGMLYRGKRLP